MRANDLQWHRLRDRGLENGIFCSPGTQLKYSIDALVSEWVSENDSRDGTATSAAARGPFPCNNVATANISEHIWEWRRRRRHFFPALVSPLPSPASSFSFKPIRSWTFCGSVQKRQRFCVACCHCCCGGCCSVLCRCTGAVAVVVVVVLVDPLSQMMCSLPNEALRNKVASRTSRNVRQLRGSMLASLL